MIVLRILLHSLCVVLSELNNSIMKNTIILGCFLLIASGLFGQADKQFIEAIQTSDYVSAESVMASKLDFCINDDQDYLKKTESIAKLQTLITDHGVKSWEVVHKGQSKDGTSNYSILESATAEKSLRILVYSEEKDGSSKVSEIRLEY